MLKKALVKEALGRVFGKDVPVIPASRHSDKYYFDDKFLIFYEDFEKFEHEFLILSKIRDRRVPEILDHYVIELPGKAVYLISFRRVKGTPLKDFKGVLDKERLSNDIISFMDLMHQVRVGKEVRWLDNLKEAMRLPKDKKEYLIERLNVPEGYSLIHGDLNPENILLDDSGALSCVVDFTTSGFGEPLQDYVVFYAWRMVLQGELSDLYGLIWDKLNDRSMINSYNFIAHFSAMIPRFRESLPLKKHLLELLYTNFTIR